ncbi:uncharacterized protein LOC121726458 isoform X2 [Aricia agestis]|uniref:uncharacterized protein LOC121726458 isoform X2 n=1 Tax=Aricia agestis TaxID=91739 RepID=UPI001C204E55|nr:uncharacterized protein LOC121726458 isoform X2 [Aricia agestis]
MALLLVARTARAFRPSVSASLRSTHAGGGRDGPVCRPSPCGAPAARAQPPPDRVACTPPPPTGHPPPCPPPAPPRTFDCEKATKKLDGRRSHRLTIDAGRCGMQLDAATARLAAAERARRDHYEREAAAHEPPPPPDFARYCLAAATDADVPPAWTVDDTTCEIHRHDYADPCARYPRREVHLDRGSKVSGGSRGLAAKIVEKFKRSNTAAERGGPSSL